MILRQNRKKSKKKNTNNNTKTPTNTNNRRRTAYSESEHNFEGVRVLLAVREDDAFVMDNTLAEGWGGGGK